MNFASVMGMSNGSSTDLPVKSSEFRANSGLFFSNTINHHSALVQSTELTETPDQMQKGNNCIPSIGSKNTSGLFTLLKSQ